MGLTTDSATPVATLAQEYLDAVSRGDSAEAAERYFHPEIVYAVNGPQSPGRAVLLPALSDELHAALPWLGSYRGLDEVRAFLGHMHANLNVTSFGPREIVGDHERAAVFGWFGLRPKGMEREARIAFSLLVQAREGKIVRYQFLENTFDVALAFRAAGSWTMRTDGKTTAVPAESER